MAEVDMRGATREGGEPLHALVASQASSVWYSWTAPSNGKAHLTTGGSDFDTVLAVYTGAQVSDLTPIVSNDDILPGIVRSEVDFDAVAGTTYRVAIAGKVSGVGNADLKLSFTPAINRVAGDSNHDGRFDSSDLVAAFIAGEYEDGVTGNSTFEEGDWNLDGEFDTADLVFAFTAGTYQVAAVAHPFVLHDSMESLFAAATDQRLKQPAGDHELVDRAFEDDLLAEF